MQLTSMTALRDKLFSVDHDLEEGVEAARMKEIERRIAELDAGTVETIPWGGVRDSLRWRLGD
jgi:hypothetical protein